MLAAFATFCTLDVCLDWNTFGLLTGDHEWAKYTVTGGWSLTAEQLYIGITRLSYPFLIGLIISRLGKTIKLKGGYWWCSLILVVLFSVPCVGGADNVLNGVYNAVCILLIFPLIVMMSAGSNITGVKSIKVCTFVGELSCPLYITHYPIMFTYTWHGHGHTPKLHSTPISQHQWGLCCSL